MWILAEVTCLAGVMDDHFQEGGPSGLELKSRKGGKEEKGGKAGKGGKGWKRWIWLCN